jgi:exopolysaccharide biosynthesis polyprenyl glycosylphosphotransferase
MRIKIQNVFIFLGFLYIWKTIFSFCGLYRSRRISSLMHEVIDVFRATSLGTAVVWVVAIFFKINMITPIFLTVFLIASTVITISSRLLLRWALKQIRIGGRNLRHVLIIGTNPRAIHYAKTITTTPELGYRLVGFADNEWSEIENFPKAGYELVCNLNNVSDFIRDKVVDEVALALPVKSLYEEALRIASICEEQGIIVRYLSSIFTDKSVHSNSSHFKGYPLTELYNGTMDGWSILIKRIMDICLSLIFLLFFLPVFAVTALTIKLTSPGPVFFVQERVGLNKRRIWMYKFRTMIADADQQQSEFEHLNEASGPVFKIKDDPRLTRIGKFLRKTSIDELPQLINVLKGDMSLVGPRPLPVRDYTGFKKDWHRRRFSIRPGITGLWQINGRSSIPFEKMIELDMYYIDRWSLWLDLKILTQTIPAVLKGSGAV